MTKIILVTGSRDNDPDEWWDGMWQVFRKHGDCFTVVIHGACKGADLTAKEIAEEQEMLTIPFPAKWAEQKRAAGPLRNRKMLDAVVPMKEYGNDVQVFAFNETITQSKGTKDMARIAWDAGLPVTVFDRHGNVLMHAQRSRWDQPNPFK